MDAREKGGRLKAEHKAIAYVVTIGLGIYVAVSIFSKAKATVGGAVGAVVDALNPANPNNIVARGADAVVQVVTGDPNTSVGSKLYDWAHPNAPRADAPATPSNAQPHAAALLKQFGPSTRSREDEAWMESQLYGPTVQTADVDDAEMGHAFMASDPQAMAADRLRYAVKVR